MQHGPLQHFHLYLNHGIALCKYTTREEANKAQMALNNCVLGNTTICAESPSECEVQSILQHLGVPAAAQSQSGSISTVSVSGGGGPSSWRPPSQTVQSRSSGMFLFNFILNCFTEPLFFHTHLFLFMRSDKTYVFIVDINIVFLY